MQFMVVKARCLSGLDHLKIGRDVQVFGHDQAVVPCVQHCFRATRAGWVISGPMFDDGKNGVADRLGAVM